VLRVIPILQGSRVPHEFAVAPTCSSTGGNTATLDNFPPHNTHTPAVPIVHRTSNRPNKGAAAAEHVRSTLFGQAQADSSPGVQVEYIDLLQWVQAVGCRPWILRLACTCPA
jgi:hypothetical protein